MKKIILKSGQELECLKVGLLKVFFTDEQISKYGLPSPGPYPGMFHAIETSEGKKCVDRAFDLEGEVISINSFNNLLANAWSRLQIRMKFGPAEELCHVKSRLARVIYIIYNNLIQKYNPIDVIVKEFNCSQEEAMWFIEEDRSFDDSDSSEDILDLCGEKISKESLIDLLDNADDYLVDENNSKRFEYQKVYEPKHSDNLRLVELHEGNGRIAREAYLRYLLAGYDSNSAIMDMARIEDVPTEEIENRLEYDRIFD